MSKMSELHTRLKDAVTQIRSEDGCVLLPELAHDIEMALEVLSPIKSTHPGETELIMIQNGSSVRIETKEGSRITNVTSAAMSMGSDDPTQAPTVFGSIEFVMGNYNVEG